MLSYPHELVHEYVTGPVGLFVGDANVGESGIDHLHSRALLGVQQTDILQGW